MNYRNLFLSTCLLISPLAYSQDMNAIGQCVGAMDEAIVIRHVVPDNQDSSTLSLYRKYIPKINAVAKELTNCFGKNPTDQVVNMCLNKMSRGDKDFALGLFDGKSQAKKAPLGNRNATDLEPTIYRLCYTATH
jgi:hypothetical protein